MHVWIKGKACAQIIFKVFYACAQTIFEVRHYRGAWAFNIYRKTWVIESDILISSITPSILNKFLLWYYFNLNVNIETNFLWLSQWASLALQHIRLQRVQLSKYQKHLLMNYLLYCRTPPPQKINYVEYGLYLHTSVTKLVSVTVFLQHSIPFQ